MTGICAALGKHGRGVIEAATGINGTDEETVRRKLGVEVGWMAEVSKANNRPVTFGLAQGRQVPEAYALVLDQVAEAVAGGADLKPQSTTRGIGVLFGFQNRTPFDRNPAWRGLRGLPMAEKLAKLGDPDYRQQMVAQANENMPPLEMADLYVLSKSAPRYDLNPADRLTAQAERFGMSAPEAFIELSLQEGGMTLFNYPFLNQEMGAVERMLTDPNVVLGLGDSGAHCGQIMDASLPTFFLTYWIREKGLFDLETAIHKLTGEAAALYGIEGRGTLAPGAYADINVIDYENMHLHGPDFVHDFPADAGRFVQRADGYAHVFVNGQEFMRNGEHTGTMAGRVLRSH